MVYEEDLCEGSTAAHPATRKDVPMTGKLDNPTNTSEADDDAAEQ